MKQLIFVFLSFITTSVFAGDFGQYFPTYLKFEGSAVHYDDETISKYGITIETLRSFYRKTKNPQFDKDNNHRIDFRDVALLVPKDAYQIIYANYWGFWQADKIKSQLVAEIVTDQQVNLGPGYTSMHVKAVQRLCKSVPDGVVGDKTIQAINSVDEKSLANELCNYRIGFYKRLSIQDKRKKKYLSGWLKRVSFFQQKILKL